MRHGNKVKKLGRKAAFRKSIISNLSQELLLHEYIVTTERKAKECRSFTEKVITHAKKGNKRMLLHYINDKLVVDKLLNIYAKRFEKRNGGYVQIFKLGHRMGDNAALSKLVLVGSNAFKIKKKKIKAKSKKAALKKEKVEEKQSVKESDKKKGVFGRVMDLSKKITDRRSTKTIVQKTRSGI